MGTFTTLTSTMMPLPNRNVDTDQIIPAAFLKITDKSGLAEGLFANWRYRDPDNLADPDPAFAFNRQEYGQAKVLLAGDNFGCGSSREHAPWALLANGFRAVISTRFADIFRSNSLKNGLLVVTVPEPVAARLFDTVAADAAATITIDLESLSLALPDGEQIPFEIDPFARHCLLEGVDQLGYLTGQIPDIEAYERSHPQAIDTTRPAATAS